MEDWNIVDQLRPPFVARPQNSSSFPCNYNYLHYPGLEMMKYPLMVGQESQAMGGGIMEKKSNNGNGNEEGEEKKKRKKKRLTSEQLESLESSFKEEIKLEPERKMKLAREVGLQPRQVAIWFQNRRARWKAKKLEDLYHALRHQFNLVSRDKHKLQQEVLELKALLKDQAAKNQVLSRGYTEIISGEEETVESTSVVGTASYHHHQQQQQQQVSEGNYGFIVDHDEEFNIPVMASPYWGTVLQPPSHP